MSGAWPSHVIDGNGRQIGLGGEIGRGGEGAVFEVSGHAKSVAKIYHRPLTPDRADKIRFMAGIQSAALTQLAAWPVDLLRLPSGQPIGLLMPKIEGRKDVHRLYSPKSRIADFLTADWRFIVRAAANIASAFGAVHEVGCVIGDINHGSVLVGQDATVRLIDCDSFQVRAQNRYFLCEVGVDTFTPPELQGKSFSGVVRTENHDNFGLAVMLFLLLFMGRHPFAGRYLRGGDMPIPRAIQEYRFPYGLRRAEVQMEEPPGAPPLSIVGEPAALLFDLAFSKSMTAGGRPSPMEWMTALRQLEKSLRQCNSNSAHWYHRSSSACPWCPMEGASGIQLFPLARGALAGISFDLAAFRRDVAALFQIGPLPALPEPHVTPSTKAVAVGGAALRANMIAGTVAAVLVAIGVLGGLKALAWPLIIGGVAAFFILRSLLDRSGEVASFRQSRDLAETKWRATWKEWELRAGPAGLQGKLEAIRALEREWEAMPAVRLQRLDALKRNVRDKQMEHFLDKFEIEDASIDGIGSGRKRTLASYGVETAADATVSKLTAVPGIGTVLRSNILSWRRSLEAKFVFDPRIGVDSRDVARVEQDILVERRKLEDRLKAALDEIKQVHGRISSTRTHFKPIVEAALQEYRQTEQDYITAKSNRW